MEANEMSDGKGMGRFTALLILWITTFLAGVGQKLKDAATNVLDDLYDEFFMRLGNFADQAEAKWRAEGDGAKRVAEVKEAILVWIRSRWKLNWIQEQLYNLAVATILKNLLYEVNGTLGHDWKAKVDKFHEQLGEILPLVD
jgi:hypothetical protein